MRRVRGDQGCGDLPPLGRPARTPPFVLRFHSVGHGEGSMHARPTIDALTKGLQPTRASFCAGAPHQRGSRRLSRWSRFVWLKVGATRCMPLGV